jgi:hypothetical protein
MLRSTELMSAQFVIAVFDDWETLQGVLFSMELIAPMHSGALLHAREDAPPQAAAVGILKEMTTLRFAHSPHQVTCTIGQLAHELSARLAAGARSVAAST